MHLYPYLFYPLLQMVAPTNSRTSAVALARLIAGVVTTPAAQLIGLVWHFIISVAKKTTLNSDFGHVKRRFDTALRSVPLLSVGEKIFPSLFV